VNWTEAYKELKKGNKVRMISWIDLEEYCESQKDGRITLRAGQLMPMDAVFLDATNWEIYKEN